MAKKMIVLTGFMFVICVTLFFVGVFASIAPMILVSLFCVAPIMLILLGVSIGSASREYAIVPKNKLNRVLS